MLKKIKCSLLLEKELSFHDGANFILVDEAASNSIGKTTALLLIDFAFGGSFYAESSEIIEALGDHEIGILFCFGEREYEFVRTTSMPNKVERMDGDLRELITLDEFKAFLKEHYRLERTGMSFRDAVGLYSRIWGKKNTDPLKPLNTVPNESGAKAVARLIKLFEMYSAVEKLAKDVRRLKGEEESVNRLQIHSYLPRTTKHEVEIAKKQIDAINNEIDKLTSELEMTRDNIEASFTPEVIRLRNRRSRISEQINELSSRVEHLNVSRSTRRSTKAIQRQLDELQVFFPSVNMRSIEEVEEFHSSLNEILDQYIEEERKKAVELLRKCKKEIEELDDRFNLIIAGGVSSAKAETEELTRLIADRMANEQIVDLYERKQKLRDDLKTTKFNEECVYSEAIVQVESLANREIRAISSDVVPNSSFPSLSLYPDRYDYYIDSDSGTGRAYAALVIFDLAILELTKLPFLIHDSVILKNIEVSALSNIVDRYLFVKSKQVFVAIDEINRLSEYQIKEIELHEALKLSVDRTLFGSAWKRKNTNQ